MTPISCLSDEVTVRPNKAMNLTVALRGFAQIHYLKPLAEAESPRNDEIGRTRNCLRKLPFNDSPRR